MLNLLEASTCARGDAECDETDAKCIAGGVVEHAVCTAERLLASDPGRFFLYKRPAVVATPPTDVVEHITISNQQSYVSSASGSRDQAADDADADDDDDSDSDSLGDVLSVGTERRIHDHFEWSTIEEFQLGDVVSQIRDHLSMWHLTPATLCELIVPPVSQVSVPPLGERYFVDVHFSKPTAMCPNPLAVAKVHFEVHVSSLLPKDYPVMVTYRFEGYRQHYYALGDRCLRSFSFQRFYIDSILAMKLAFYAQICELRHPRHLLHQYEHHYAQLSHQQSMYKSRNFANSSVDTELGFNLGLSTNRPADRRQLGSRMD